MAKIVDAFRAKNAREYACGEKAFTELAKEQGRSFFNLFKETVVLNDLDGKKLYEGKVWKWQGKDMAFQRCIEQAVSKGVALPRLDARNRKFLGMQIPCAKIAGASFEGSELFSQPLYMQSRYGSQYICHRHTSFAKSDLQGVSFAKAHIDAGTMVMESNVSGADFRGQDNLRKKLDGFAKMKNLDKANGVSDKDLKVWQKIRAKESSVNVAVISKQKTR